MGGLESQKTKQLESCFDHRIPSSWADSSCTTQTQADRAAWGCVHTQESTSPGRQKKKKKNSIHPSPQSDVGNGPLPLALPAPGIPPRPRSPAPPAAALLPPCPLLSRRPLSLSRFYFLILVNRQKTEKERMSYY